MKTSAKTLGLIKKTAIAAAEASAKVLMKYYQKKLTVKDKPGAGIVTNADIAAEEAALKIFKKATPSFDIYAEESAPQPGKRRSEAQWIIDPCDGTTNYFHGFPMFCVSIGA